MPSPQPSSAIDQRASLIWIKDQSALLCYAEGGITYSIARLPVDPPDSNVFDSDVHELALPLQDCSVFQAPVALTARIVTAVLAELPNGDA
jgi:hypothetical protein